MAYLVELFNFCERAVRHVLRTDSLRALGMTAVALAALATNASATTIGPPPCAGALALYTDVGTLANVDGSHRRAADVEARLAILDGRARDSGTRVGWAYVDEEGDVWVAFDPGAARARADWRHVAPGIDRHAPVYALLERLGIPHGYRLTACTS